MSVDPWVWVSALLTLAIMSYLYKDNPVYKFAEYLFVGIAAGYFVSIYFDNVLKPNLFQPIGRATTGMFTDAPVDYKDLDRYLALVLGLMMFARFLPKGGWLSRWPIGFLVGAFAGLAMIGAAQGDLVLQIDANLISLVKPGAWSTLTGAQGFTETLMGALWLFGNIILIVGLLVTLYYFFFSKEHQGISGKTAKLGIYFLMVSFGASYGFTVMARISLALDRLRFLFSDWLGLPLIS